MHDGSRHCTKGLPSESFRTLTTPLVTWSGSGVDPNKNFGQEEACWKGPALMSNVFLNLDTEMSLFRFCQWFLQNGGISWPTSRNPPPPTHTVDPPTQFNLDHIDSHKQRLNRTLNIFITWLIIYWEVKGIVSMHLAKLSFHLHSGGNEVTGDTWNWIRALPAT